MAAAGLVEPKERQGVRKRLREKLAEDLGFYKATPEEIEQTYQAVMAQLAGAGESLGGE
jgi:hypothetical protein